MSYPDLDELDEADNTHETDEAEEAETSESAADAGEGDRLERRESSEAEDVAELNVDGSGDGAKSKPISEAATEAQPETSEGSVPKTEVDELISKRADWLKQAHPYPGQGDVRTMELSDGSNFNEETRMDGKGKQWVLTNPEGQGTAGRTKVEEEGDQIHYHEKTVDSEGNVTRDGWTAKKS